MRNPWNPKPYSEPKGEIVKHGSANENQNEAWKWQVYGHCYIEDSSGSLPRIPLPLRRRRRRESRSKLPTVASPPSSLSPRVWISLQVWVWLCAIFWRGFKKQKKRKNRERLITTFAPERGLTRLSSNPVDNFWHKIPKCHAKGTKSYWERERAIRIGP